MEKCPYRQMMGRLREVPNDKERDGLGCDWKIVNPASCSVLNQKLHTFSFARHPPSRRLGILGARLNLVC